ncbi:MAG TPA: hypothetical protein VIX42_08640 [Edaphobacter sp.]
MPNLIQSLDDATAIRIVKRIASLRPAPGGERIAWSPDLEEALADEFQVGEPVGTLASEISEGELARQALQVLAEDPEMAETIERMASTPPQNTQVFDFGIGLTVAVLIVLQTHVKFERGPDGKWSLKVEKKATSDSLLKGLVQKLIGFAK